MPSRRSRHAQDVRCNTAPSWQGGPLARPRCIPPAWRRSRRRASSAPTKRLAVSSPLGKGPPSRLPKTHPWGTHRRSITTRGVRRPGPCAEGFAPGDDQRAFEPLGTLTNPPRIGCASASRCWTTTYNPTHPQNQSAIAIETLQDSCD